MATQAMLSTQQNKQCRGNMRELFFVKKQEGQYGPVDKTHPSRVRPGFNTRVQH